MHLQSLRPWVAAIAAFAVASCAQTPATDPAATVEAPEQVITDHEACAYYPTIFLSNPIVRQGAEITIQISEPVGAYAPRPIPRELLTGWKASPAGQVDLARDGAKFSVRPTATPGTEVTLAATFCGQREITRTVRIIGKDEPVLTGNWREESKTCTGETPNDPVNELEIKDLGDFSVTYYPFESYRDYWGKAVFDAKAGTLAMTTTGGNRVPGGAKLSGKVRLTPEGKLVLDGFFLSQPQTMGGECRYVFAK